MGGETEKEILEILARAMRRENDSELMYRHAAELSTRKEVKDVLLRLADEESTHEEVVRELYHQTKKRLGLKILHEDEPDG